MRARVAQDSQTTCGRVCVGAIGRAGSIVGLSITNGL